MRPRSLASGSTTTRRALTTATPPAPKSHALAAVGAAAGALGSVAVGGLRRDSTHDSAGRRAPRGQRDLSRRRHVHGRCRRRCLLRGPRRRRREGALHHGRSRSGRRRRRRRRLRGVGPVARRRPRRGLGPLGRGTVDVFAVDTIDVRLPASGHAADVVASHRSSPERAVGRSGGPLAIAPYVFGVRRRAIVPLRPCRLRGFLRPSDPRTAAYG